MKKNYVKGVLDIRAGGYGFVRRSTGDVFVPESLLNGAVHGQEVVAELEFDDLTLRERGRVVKICSPYPEIVGTVFTDGKNLIVKPDDCHFDYMQVGRGKGRGASDGDKVVAKMETPAKGYSWATCSITEILGAENESGVDILCVARTFGLKAEFSKEIEKFARGLRYLPDNCKREDLRGKTVFTIDNDDAKDLDDAVSVERAGENYLLGVHIADVSHYVRENSPVDEEALKRGTSVYLSDMVVPMLPKVLSDDLCSLNAGEDKLTLSCFMEITPGGRIISSDIKKTIINSCGRLTYSGVNALYEGHDEKGYAYLEKELRMLLELSHILKKKREEGGSIDFDMNEPRIIQDENGIPVDITVPARGEAEKVIEECMLAANMTVAETYRMMEIPFVYRTHEQPDGKDIHELSVFLSGLGIALKGSQNIHPGAIQRVIMDAAGTNEAGIINRVVLRSLKKAKYDVIPRGHFGLATENYCHFTSPIRRYPDLTVHRIISGVLSGKCDDSMLMHFDEVLPGIAEKASEREINAVQAERKIRDIKMAQYMKNYIGETFSGIISGVTNFALFVELDNSVEGMVPLFRLRDDEYALDQKNFRLIGEITGNIIRIGDKFDVICENADINTGKIEFAPVKKYN